MEAGEDRFERLDTGDDGVWRECEQRLSEELSSGEYETWIRPLQAEWGKGELLLLAPNQYVKEEVEGRYFGRIKELVFRFGGAAGSIRGVRVAVDRRDANGPGVPLRAGPHVSQGDLANGDEWKDEQGNGLNLSYVFDTFVEGKSNQLAKAAAMQLADSMAQPHGPPKTPYNNPLCLYGGVGLGKTHLMQAVGNQVLAKTPNLRVAYVPSERFGNDIVRGVRTHTIQEVTQRYRSVDVLLIDDIQFFAEKTGFQEEFFHVFNAVLERGSVVLTADRYPAQIPGLEKRLKSRFSGGLPVEVDMPELETRVAILQNKGEAAGIEIPQDVAFHIAERIRSNVRELEGALARVLATAQLRKVEVTMGLVRDTLRALFAIQSRQITIANIQHTVADYYRIKQSDMLSKRRSRAIARPRQIAMCLAKEFTNHSLPEIGEQFGGRDHTTVLYACRKVAELRKSTEDIAEDYRNLARLLDS